MKTTFRKLTALLMALMLLIATFGCSSDSDKDDEKEKEGVEDSVDIDDENDTDNENDDDETQSSKLSFRDCVTIATGHDHIVGLKSDGTVVAVGGNSYGKCDVSGWTDIIAVSASNDHTVGLKSDGTVVTIGGDFGLSAVNYWTDIKLPE